MGLLQKLKSALGLDASGSPSAGGNTPQDVDVTVEREPSTESEDAVKGTETDTSGATYDADTATESESASEQADADTDDESETTVAAATPEPTDEPSVDNDAPVTEIKGVGPAYAERLENAGISTVSELAAADADELGEVTDLSPNRISGWIEQANAF
ncbi:MULTISPECIES: helix-hairpin-helix domain-containing protein [Halomicrobium]|uniref:Helix-hairpin-helix domain-containing protein n=2 Tax=Halomicrobium mukohataei TaxID=57705 RepID=C7P121_HALMD|nr:MULTISPECIES: helix-hairpin-helix domain-containing protein [Halomicrobium]ACV49036.1 conserved hypothetical protein [Halomicrobium mukohataei DSM 12286]QCD64457.1 DUF4332 domain-containing protein [Halomicrobium mukohataei]QFR19263.1 DUF4332 domain-containing protein [Halomicrobium sp. ZPS1]